MLTEEHNSLMAQLEEAANSGNIHDIDQVLLPAFWAFERHEEFRIKSIPLLIKILAYLNHYNHEDIVRLLQQARDSRAVDALYNAALNIPEYQADYDDGAALARKCTWALADIGNEEAYHKLQLLAEHNNPEIAGYAHKRLRLWHEELSRKAYQFNP